MGQSYGNTVEQFKIAITPEEVFPLMCHIKDMGFRNTDSGMAQHRCRTVD